MLALAAVVAALLGVFLASQTIGRLVPAATPWRWGADQIFATRGTSVHIDDRLAVTAVDKNGVAAVSVRHAPFHASDFLALKVRAEGVPSDVRLSFAWSTDRSGRDVHQVAIPVEEGEPRGVMLSGHPQWQGRVIGLAVTIQGPLRSAVLFEEIVLTPGGMRDTARELWKSWTMFERWSLRSVSYLNGGSATQLLTLPLVLGAASAVVGLIVLLGARRLGWRTSGAAFAVLALLPWLALDLRWARNLVEQNRATWRQFAGKSVEERQYSADDGFVFAFAEVAGRKIPMNARVFVTASNGYLRARLAFHLRPHDVWFELRADRPPEARWLQPGDYVVVFMRDGFDFDRASGRLKWGADAHRSAELVHADPLGTVYVIR